jgi:hypothetical protein
LGWRLFGKMMMKHYIQTQFVSWQGKKNKHNSTMRHESKEFDPRRHPESIRPLQSDSVQ